MSGERGANGPKINAVVLDYGEVLCHRPADEEWSSMAKVFGTDRDSFHKLWDKNRGAFDRGDLTAEADWAMLAEDAGAVVSAEQLNQVGQWDVTMWGKANPQMVASGLIRPTSAEKVLKSKRSSHSKFSRR